ncbi:MAG: sensor domain-containing phosphodiesterase [Acidobacteria bacterium]|nr:sensor domain-containing phosphodiesterase [Acidobacteriota bacterium]
MQKTLLDIIILGLLILLFGSIYLKWATRRLQFWILGWLSVLAHFCVLLVSPTTNTGQSLQSFMQFGFLLLGGVSFILASSAVSIDAERVWSTAAALSFPPLIYAALVTFGGTNPLILDLIAICGETLVLLLTVRFYRQRPLVLYSSFFAAALNVLTTVVSTLHKRPELGIYAALTQLFFMNAVLFWDDFRRISAGVITAGIGLLVWAAVFPSAVVFAAFFPQINISPEVWNVPKYFVEFGMVLTLLEDELEYASRQSLDYRLLFDGNPLPMWIFDRKTLAFLRVNDAAIRHYGYSREQFLLMTIHDLCPAEALEDRKESVVSSIVNSTVTGPTTHILRSGHRIQVEEIGHTIKFEGRDAHFIMINDVTDRQLLHNQLVHQAQHDMLTGLPNRLLLRDRMEQALVSAARHSQKAAVVCIDLDRFKQINDIYGHAAGDAVLQQVAVRLKARLRQMDTVARTGGEEFTVVLGGLASARDAGTVANNLIESFREPFSMDGFMLEISASLGVAIYPDDGLDSELLWKSADAAMYRAKNSGGNQYVCVSREISNSASEATELEVYLRRILKEGGLELYYQPQYTIDEKLCGFEALVRLRHPRFGLVLPDRFIPIAEESGLIVSLGNWVIEEVCRQSRAWVESGLPQLRIAVNVSPLQFMRVDFSNFVEQVLKHHNMDPHLIEFEVTETTVMRNLDEVARQMRVLSDQGIRFSVDDFGTGYSSLRHLHQLPISTLKIDRSFVERICERNGTYSIVEATLSLAHSLGMNVVAEGVENKQQWAILRDLGCDVMQGFLFSPPISSQAVPALVEAATPVTLRSARG